MKYAIVIAAEFVREAPDVDTVWDGEHYCKPSKLTPDERLLFGVVDVVPTLPPVYDAITQGVVEKPPVFQNAVWKQVWAVESLPAEVIAQNQELQRYALDAAVVRADVKLQALRAMSPAALKAWVAANVTNLAQAKDAIATLAIAVGLLSRRI